MKAVTILPKIYTRDFSISLCQTWGKFYKDFNINETIYPRQVILVQDGLMHAYRSKYLNHKICSEILNRTKQDKNYIKNYFNTASKGLGQLKSIATKKICSRKEWYKAMNFITEYWGPLILPIFIPKDGRFKKTDREAAMKFRLKTEKLEHLAFENLSESLGSFFPRLKENTKLIFLEEVKLASISSQKIKKRKSGALYIVDDEVVSKIVFNKLKNKYKFDLEKMKIEKSDEICGSVAFPGKIKGKVRKILRIEDLSLFKKGEILVSYMTVPTFLSAIKKASAFITDEGGITCHAAIVAREMKKPCIVGTKVATKVLKDGDLVEVDANKGVVTKVL